MNIITIFLSTSFYNLLGTPYCLGQYNRPSSPRLSAGDIDHWSMSFWAAAAADTATVARLWLQLAWWQYNCSFNNSWSPITAHLYTSIAIADYYSLKSQEPIVTSTYRASAWSILSQFWSLKIRRTTVWNYKMFSISVFRSSIIVKCSVRSMIVDTSTYIHTMEVEREARMAGWWWWYLITAWNDIPAELLKLSSNERCTQPDWSLSTKNKEDMSMVWLDSLRRWNKYRREHSYLEYEVLAVAKNAFSLSVTSCYLDILDANRWGLWHHMSQIPNRTLFSKYRMWFKHVFSSVRWQALSVHSICLVPSRTSYHPIPLARPKS